jgi:hypothetical protein
MAHGYLFWSGCGFYSEEFAGGPFGGLSGRSGGEHLESN